MMPNSLKLLNHYILSNAPQKIRQWALKLPQTDREAQHVAKTD